jgi:hypothetical protein
MVSYNVAVGVEAWYSVSEDGFVTVNVRSNTQLNPRAVYVGAATLDFKWVHTGKTTHWQFTPTITTPIAAKYTQAADGQSQITTIELGKALFPASGLIKSNLTGQIQAPAIQFDLPYATDLWVFLLRSPWTPFKIDAERSPLSITHGSSQALTQIYAANFEDNCLRLDTAVNGSDFKSVYHTLKRSINYESTEETLTILKGVMGSFSWQPIVRTFDLALVTYSNLTNSDLTGFLRYLGAPTNQGIFSGSLNGDYILCDGPAIEYTLSLKGEKRFWDKEDQTKITLKP